eukprot:GILJ01011351.1.p1 GENE.GILJ01011351.1~~GILJ01011351.1.p1  ORF type:complete len:643 (+),score=162.47 GILJ01011351.1:25-1929(+)
MEAQGIQIDERQQQGLQSRKKLVEETKAFKSQPPESKVASVGPLLKSYQEEIDVLTKRAKAAETSFLTMYRSFFEAPDPVATLALAMKPSVETESGSDTELQRLRKEVEEYEEEFHKLKNQDVTVRALRDQLRKYELMLEEKVREASDSKEQETQQALETAKQEFASRERQLLELLAEEKEANSHLLKLTEDIQTQLQHAQTRSDELVSAKQSQLDILSEDIDRAQELIQTLQREKEKVESQLNHLRVADVSAASINQVHLESLLEEREHEVTSLQQSLRSLDEKYTNVKRQFEDTTAAMREELQQKEAHLRSTERELQQRPTTVAYEQLKEQLRLYEAVEYNAMDDNGSTIDESLEENKNLTPLEKLLLAKKKHLEAELTKAKNSMDDLRQRSDHLDHQLESAKDTIQDQKNLISKLEEDLTKKSTISADAQMNKVTTTVERPFGQGFDASAHMNDIVESLTATKQVDDSNMFSMNQILTGQRDRFRSRVLELEREKERLQQQNDSQGISLEQLRKDNVKLYEKIRYLETYASQKQQTSAAASTDIEAGPEKRYKQMYEENMNPFEEFSRNERNKRYQDLNAVERIALSSGRLLLSHKYPRQFVIFYVLALHLLVFLTVYRMSYFQGKCTQIN